MATTEGRAPLIELRDVSRTYAGGTEALRQVDLTIGRGELVAIVGRSGSGKSTLLSILGLLDVPSSGTVLFDGTPVPRSDGGRSELRSRELAFVFQRSHLIGGLTSRQNVQLGLRYGAVPTSEWAERTEAALAAVELEHRVDATARTLSGGEMQRVAVARALARPTSLWMADEPTGNLDSQQSDEVMDHLIAAARQHGSALVVVTHEPEIAAKFDRVVHVHDGEIVRDSGTTELRSDDAIDASGPVRRARARSALLASALESMSAHRGRSASAIAAGAVAIALTVVAIGLAQSARAQVSGVFDAQRARELSAQIVYLDPADQTSAAPVLVDGDLNQLRSYPGVVDTGLWSKWDDTEITNGPVAATSALVIATTDEGFRATSSRVRWSRPNAGFGPGVVVLGDQLAQRLQITQLSLEPEIEVAGVPLRVVGILGRSRSGEARGAAFVDPAIADRLPRVGVADVFVRTDAGAAAVLAPRLARLLDPFEEVHPDVAPVRGADAYRSELEDDVATSLRVLAAVAGIAGIVIITTTNILNVGSRRAELGIRRAFGARRRSLVGLVMTESVLLGFGGAILGSLIGFVGIMVVTIQARWHPVFSLELLAVAGAASVVFGVLGGIAPAVVASRVEPSEAVRAA